MSTGMRKWMEKGCPDIPTTPAEVSIGREELRQLRDELAQYKNERDSLHAELAQLHKEADKFEDGIDWIQPAPSVPNGWLRAIDEALVVTHLGVANESDTYEQAREKLNNLIGWHTDVATDPAVNGGWKLVPIEPTPLMKTAGIGVEVYQDSPPSSDCLTWEEVEAIYTAMLAAAPEAKP